MMQAGLNNSMLKKGSLGDFCPLCKVWNTQQYPKNAWAYLPLMSLCDVTIDNWVVQNALPNKVATNHKAIYKIIPKPSTYGI